MTVQNLHDEELKQFPCNKATNNKKEHQYWPVSFPVNSPHPQKQKTKTKKPQTIVPAILAL